MRGKLIRKSLKTDALTVAKLRLADMEKAGRQSAESQTNVTRGKMTFGEVVEIYRQRITGDVSLKQPEGEALIGYGEGVMTSGLGGCP